MVPDAANKHYLKTALLPRKVSICYVLRHGSVIIFSSHECEGEFKRSSSYYSNSIKVTKLIYRPKTCSFNSLINPMRQVNCLVSEIVAVHHSTV